MTRRVGGAAPDSAAAGDDDAETEAATSKALAEVRSAAPATGALESLRRRISLRAAQAGALGAPVGVSIETVVEEENRGGGIHVERADVEEALAHVKDTNVKALMRRRSSTFRRPMTKDMVAKVHVELLKTREFKEAWKLYDRDGDGRADATDVYRVMVTQGEDITFEQALQLMATVCEPGESSIDFRGFCRLMRDDDDDDDDEADDGEPKKPSVNAPGAVNASLRSFEVDEPASTTPKPAADSETHAAATLLQQKWRKGSVPVAAPAAAPDADLSAADAGSTTEPTPTPLDSAEEASDGAKDETAAAPAAKAAVAA